MGAYLVLYPRARVFTLVPVGFMMTSIALPAWVMLLYWSAVQFIGGLAGIGGEGGGVAFWAHVGGFVAGIALVKLLSDRRYIQAHRARRWHPQRTGW
jgi:membrane associated rhomboid family serine protease